MTGSKETPLFIPLKAKYFRAFEEGTQTIERRPYGARWNEDTCKPGRDVLLSLGYGKRERLLGRIVAFRVSTAASRTRDWIECYGPGECKVACLEIEVTHG